MFPSTNRTNHNSGSSSLIHTRNTFEIEEPSTNTKIWYQWLSIRIRQYMILEIFFVISLIMNLYRLQTISNQNDLVLGTDISPSDNTEPLEQSIANILKTMKFPTQDDSTDKVEPIIIPQMNQSISESAESPLKVPISNELFRFNAADYLRGATVDMDHSSSSNLNPIIGYDQTNLVLLDRPQPPADKAWCSNAENPVLTINLAKYIKPISVSYQHSKWNGAIPNGAPKIYDVVACLDFYCEKWKPLVSNCEYSQNDSNEAEQMCNISTHLDVPLIGKVQFRFRENYGDTKMICVHLVRVYGETTTPLKIEQKSLESEEICTDLRWYYHNSYFKYTWTDKNCSVLYENSCCSECPECCQECLISDYNKYTFGYICLGIFFGIVVLFFVFLVYKICEPAIETALWRARNR
ncbi:hypothetical protein B9Z55_015052 [Caenorhabditis nigoni]|uniref:SUN domain-containing protein n=1 Tax=Caenorhabditis nigoni TaxID=1611254 RepID=A0A2G5U8Y6_9PELO|nr:hypothetical protein B9Z55_015052 [Caenorhabditis nigoni]